MASGENALISVSNKEGIVDFAGGLHEMDWNIYASGGTASEIERAGIPVINVAELIGSEAILDHRVVTLSKEVHAGLLADPRKDMHVAELESLGIPFLDLVAIDMYPLKQAVEDGLNEEEIIEKTDVGGPTMLHSAAKGRRIAVSRAIQRPVVLEWLKNGKPDEEKIVRTLAAVAEKEVSEYIGESWKYLAGLVLANDPTTSYEATLRAPLY